MGIQELPQTAIRALGANQVITDAASLVKELIDNALDARSTSIAVEISNNTLDVIQVRDNGHGIAPGDRSLVARRYCTSKITNETDLASIGGSSLGFRGEALASVAEMSGSLTITTRVEGEPVAVALKIGHSGEVVAQDRASLPPGTTVKVTDFIRANPVRKQVALKTTDATFKRLKHILQAYAFARPHVRLSLRVLKAKTPKMDWTYAPNLNGNVEDVAYKVVGAACASHCSWVTREDNGMAITALLPRWDADPAHISNMGGFLCIDRRPVAAHRGTPKSVVKAFREALRSANPKFHDVKDPFLCLDITCQPGAYDVNVEPGKDDVLFEDSNGVVALARKLFASVYEKSATDDLGNASAQFADLASRTPAAAAKDADDALPVPELPMSAWLGPYADRPDPNLHTQAVDLTASASEERQVDEQHVTHSRRAFRSNMYGCDEEDLECLEAAPSTDRTETYLNELRLAKDDVSLSNPWVLAKLNSSLRNREASTQLPPQLERENELPSSSPSMLARRIPYDTTAAHLPTPRPSSPPPPRGPHHSQQTPDLCSGQERSISDTPTLPAAQSVIPALVHYPTDRALEIPQHYARAEADQPSMLFIDQDSAGTLLSDIPDATRPRRSRPRANQSTHINKPFVSPIVRGPQQAKVQPGHRGGSQQPRSKHPYQHGRSDGLVARGEPMEFTEAPRPLSPPPRNRDIRDFVGRVVESNNNGSLLDMRSEHDFVADRNLAGDTENDARGQDVDGRMEMSGALGFVAASRIAALGAAGGIGGSKVGPSSPQRRKTSHRPALQELDANTCDATEALPADREDPSLTAARAPSRRKSSRKSLRRKSSRLPLERTPAGRGVHNLTLSLSLTCRDLSSLACKLAQQDNTFPASALPARPEMYTGIHGTDAADAQALAAKLLDVMVATGSVAEGVDAETVVQALKHAFPHRGDGDDEDDFGTLYNDNADGLMSSLCSLPDY